MDFSQLSTNPIAKLGSIEELNEDSDSEEDAGFDGGLLEFTPKVSAFSHTSIWSIFDLAKDSTKSITVENCYGNTYSDRDSKEISEFYYELLEFPTKIVFISDRRVGYLSSTGNVLFFRKNIMLKAD